MRIRINIFVCLVTSSTFAFGVLPTNVSSANSLPLIQHQEETESDPFLKRLDGLIRVFESTKDSDSLIEALEKMELFGEDGAPAVPALIKLLEHKDPHVKVAAADALASIGEPAKAAIKPLAKMMLEDWELGQNEPTSPRFGKALGHLGPDAYPYLAEALKSDDMRIFSAGAEGLVGLGADAQPAMPMVIELLQSKNRLRQWGGAYIVEAMGTEGEEAVPYLGALLKHESFQQHVIGSRAISAIGPPAKQWAPELYELLENGVVSSRSHAAMALGAIGPVEGVNPLDLMIERSTQFSDPVRERCLIGIGRLGKDGEAAAPHLRKLLADPNYRNRPQAALALYRVTGETDLPIESLVSMFDDLTYQLDSIRHLGEMGHDGEGAVEALTKLVETGDADLKYEAIRSLGMIGAPASDVLPKLEKLKSSSDLWIAGAAHRAIKRIKEDMQSSAQ